MNRRTFLKCLGAAAGGALVTAPRAPALARVPVDPVAVLVVDFVGAWNVHATFAARTNPDVNPHGIYVGDTGIVRPSNLLLRNRDDLVSRDAPSWGDRIPGFEDAARRYSIIGAMRHSLSYALDDHVTTSRFCATGYLDRTDVPGIGTLIGRFAPRGTKAPPAVVVDAGNASAEMARAPGPWQPYAPLVLQHDRLPVSRDASLVWSATESAIDDGARATRRSLATAKIDSMRRFKEAFRTYRRFFLDPAIDPYGDPSARYADGLLGSASPTTQQLLEAFGGSGLDDEAKVALAFRCLEGGARFVSVGIGSFDSHQDEASTFDRYVQDAHILAGLSYVLEKTGLAKKVLVVALSEMARSPYLGGSYNEAHGTDHGSTGLVTPKGQHGSNRQTILLAHGPIVPGREVYPADPEWGDPLGQPCITAELLALLAECAGVERGDHPWADSPDGAPLSADALAGALIG